MFNQYLHTEGNDRFYFSKQLYKLGTAVLILRRKTEVQRIDNLCEIRVLLTDKRDLSPQLSDPIDQILSHCIL